MPHYGLLRNYRLENLTGDDIRGATVYGRNDEKLGKISDVIFDHSGVIKYVVVDAGASFSHQKFLVPSHRLHTSGPRERDVSVNLDRQQIADFPLYKDADLDSEEKWRDYERKVEQAWHSGPVQSKRGRAEEEIEQ
ncbi:MAG: PRC-barrel domain-containing protein [Acidobacteria bacterium]|nr:PRC-barrel domain-containing protein [Acidobacteriota bacterium]